MSDRHLLALADRLQRVVDGGEREARDGVHRLDAARYLDPQRWVLEREQVLRRHPQIAARSAELDGGGWQSLEIAGRPLLLTRDADGRARAYVNACRHRGMQLLGEGQTCAKAKISCPYHGWTYDPAGALTGLPHADCFPGLDRADMSLTELPCAERHGFVWVLPAPGETMPELGDWLGTIDDDLSALELESHVVYAEGRSRVQGNWKLCVDAFLEAYHVRVLHRKTVGPFFHDALACYDTAGPHTRSAVARLDPGDGPNGLRDRVSFTHFVFPNQVFVMHPDYISQMSIDPRSESQFDWCHRMLIPAERATPGNEAHWRRSFELIEDGVFQAEDLRAVERNNAGLAAGGHDEVVLGELETLIVRFHRHLDALLDGNSAVASE